MNRCVTICRWVVIIVKYYFKETNNYLKNDFLTFRPESFGISVPHMMEFFFDTKPFY